MSDPIDPHYIRHTELEKKVNRLDNAMSEMAANVNSLANNMKTMQEGMRDIHTDTKEQLTRIAQDVNSRGRISPGVVLGVFSVAGLMLGGLTAFIILHTAPIKEQVNAHSAFMERTAEAKYASAYQAGELAAVVRGLEQRSLRDSELLERTVRGVVALQERSNVFDRVAVSPIGLGGRDDR